MTAWVLHVDLDQFIAAVEVLRHPELSGRLAELVAAELATMERPANRVVVKVRHAPFITQTHRQPLAGPTVDAAVIREAALAALDRFTRRRPVRLLGVRAEFRRPPEPSRACGPRAAGPGRTAGPLRPGRTARAAGLPRFPRRQ